MGRGIGYGAYLFQSAIGDWDVVVTRSNLAEIPSVLHSDLGNLPGKDGSEPVRVDITPGENDTGFLARETVFLGQEGGQGGGPGPLGQGVDVAVVDPDGFCDLIFGDRHDTLGPGAIDRQGLGNGHAYSHAIEEFEYSGLHYPLYPMKVNPRREVVEEFLFLDGQYTEVKVLIQPPPP